MPSQTETLRLYTALALYRADWGGQLLLHLGLNETGRNFALASLAAGAATLILEPDAKHVREASREGCLTFSVTTLDEALRALKNEIRQGRAVSIGLAGEPVQWLHEMVERGVLPTTITASQAHTGARQAALQTVQQWGSQPLHGHGLVAVNRTSRNIEAQLQASIAEDTASTWQQRRSNDEALCKRPSNAFPQALQERWFTAAPTLFPRAFNRAYWHNP